MRARARAARKSARYSARLIILGESYLRFDDKSNAFSGYQKSIWLIFASLLLVIQNERGLLI